VCPAITRGFTCDQGFQNIDGHLWKLIYLPVETSQKSPADAARHQLSLSQLPGLAKSF
jgi:hypothetical protein